ncbi:hypothetical protein ABZ905_32180 [Streptomyces parvus]|uniref:hypothetical protein n=1 Tax=Streptomyces parvus TaxID=66428 RepID=UPI0033CDB940
MLRRILNRVSAAAVAAGLVALLALALLATVNATARSADSPAPTITVTGDDNRDGTVDEDETGWDCRTMGNRLCGPAPQACQRAGAAAAQCATVASRPAYAWTNPDGSRVNIPDGRALVLDLDERPGTPEFAAAVAALDAEWRDHH